MSMSDETRHNYEYGVELDSGTAPARVVRMVGHDKRVLEIGAGPGSITRHLQGAGNCSVTAMEIDAEAIKKLSPFCERVYQTDLNDAAWPEVLVCVEKFDVVVAADVLEHLYDPWTTLKAMGGLLNSDGYIVISLPHVGHSAIAACLLDEDFDYRDWGLLDRTHIRFFGLKNMQALFEDAGLRIIDAQFVITPPEESEFSDRWRSLPREMQKVLADNPFGQVYQVVIKAVPEERGGHKLDLMSLPVAAMNSPAGSDSGFVSSCKSLARRHLGPGARSRIQGVARVFGIKV